MENKSDAVKYIPYVLSPYVPIVTPKLKIKSRYAEATIDASYFGMFNIIKTDEKE